MESQVRHNFHQDCEAGLNRMINLKFHSSYIYLSLKPERDDWSSGLEALQTALKLEKTVNQALLELHSVAGDKNDPHMCNFLECPFLSESTETIKKLGDYITSMKKLGASHTGMAEYLFNKHTLG
ncbi:hypothetical protein FKM82_013339 [Ascaphus truei]